MLKCINGHLSSDNDIPVAVTSIRNVWSFPINRRRAKNPRRASTAPRTEEMHHSPDGLRRKAPTAKNPQYTDDEVQSPMIHGCAEQQRSAYLNPRRCRRRRGAREGTGGPARRRGDRPGAPGGAGGAPCLSTGRTDARPFAAISARPTTPPAPRIPLGSSPAARAGSGGGGGRGEMERERRWVGVFELRRARRRAGGRRRKRSGLQEKEAAALFLNAPPPRFELFNAGGCVLCVWG